MLNDKFFLKKSIKKIQKSDHIQLELIHQNHNPGHEIKITS
jgi:hypothetical protein